jgi:hypothetical protein
MDGHDDLYGDYADGGYADDHGGYGEGSEPGAEVRAATDAPRAPSGTCAPLNASPSTVRRLATRQAPPDST